MRIVVPVSSSDVDLIPQWVEVHKHLRCGMNHQLFFVATPSTEGVAQDAKAQLLDTFENVTVHRMDYEPYGGHPKAPNMHFWECCNLMGRTNKNIPFQLVELDCLPIRSNTYDTIASRYVSSGAPFFGFVSPAPWRDTEPYLLDQETGRPTTSPNPSYGKIARSPFGPTDVMMSGCAVYPGDIIERPHFSGMMADFMKGEASANEAWDVYLRAAMRTDGMIHTDLIQSPWNTVNFRVENGSIVCDSRETHEIFERHPNWQIRKCGGRLHHDAVLIHGCKDDSLYRLIMADAIPELYHVPTITASTQGASQPPSVSDPRLDRLESIVSNLATAIASMNKPTPEIAPPKVCVTNPVPASSGDILKKLETALTSDKPVRLNELALKIGCSPSEVKEAIKADSTISMSGPPAQWVKRIAA